MTSQVKDVASEMATDSSRSTTATPSVLPEESIEDDVLPETDEQRGYGGLVLLGAALVLSVFLAAYLIGRNRYSENGE